MWAGPQTVVNKCMLWFKMYCWDMEVRWKVLKGYQITRLLTTVYRKTSHRDYWWKVNVRKQILDVIQHVQYSKLQYKYYRCIWRSTCYLNKLASNTCCILLGILNWTFLSNLYHDLNFSFTVQDSIRDISHSMHCTFTCMEHHTIQCDILLLGYIGTKYSRFIFVLCVDGLCSVQQACSELAYRYSFEHLSI